MPQEANKVFSETYVVFTRFCKFSFTCKQLMAILVYGKLNTRKLNTESSTQKAQHIVKQKKTLHKNSTNFNTFN